MTESEEVRVRQFKELMVCNGKPVCSDEVIEQLVEWGFFSAPASTKYHGSYEGGLYDHSSYVTTALLDLTVGQELEWERPESPYIIGMFHDLCKTDQYNEYYYGEYEFNTKSSLKGHGEKSIALLSTLMQLTMEEVMCIRYHMGAFTDKSEWSDYTRAIHAYPNVLWTHTADMMATHITGV